MPSLRLKTSYLLGQTTWQSRLAETIRACIVSAKRLCQEMSTDICIISVDISFYLVCLSLVVFFVCFFFVIWLLEISATYFVYYSSQLLHIVSCPIHHSSHLSQIIASYELYINIMGDHISTGKLFPSLVIQYHFNSSSFSDCIYCHPLQCTLCYIYFISEILLYSYKKTQKNNNYKQQAQKSTPRTQLSVRCLWTISSGSARIFFSGGKSPFRIKIGGDFQKMRGIL